MLLRAEHVMLPEQEKAALDHLQHALCVRQYLPQGIPQGKGRIWIPSCHCYAHAYGKVFGLRVVDGEIAYLKGSQLISATWWREEQIALRWGFIKHSWIEIDASGRIFILDVFPEAACGILPLLLPYPHPAYYVPDDSKHKGAIQSKLDQDEFKLEVECLAKMIEKIAHDRKLI